MSPKKTTAETDKKKYAKKIGKDRLMKILADMLLIRRFEERTMQSYMQQKIGGFCHIYIGQEAAAVGAAAALNETDAVIGGYRDHGLALARGMHPNYGMAEMFGKATGCAKGKGGSMHFFDRDRHMYGGHAIVGGQCPMAVGIAFGQQYEEKDNVTLCYFGDGALNQGALFEAMNLAAIWNLPVIFVLENNGYSMGTHIARGTAMANDLKARAEAFGMRYAECDGMDVLDTMACFEREVSKTRGSKNPQWKRGGWDELSYSRDGAEVGPCFINVKTYRYQGHSMSDPQKYRDKAEVETFKQRDCVQTLVSMLIEQGVATQDEIDTLDNAAKQAAIDSVAYAEASPEMAPEELHSDVYVNPWEGSPYSVTPLPNICVEGNSGE